MTYKDMLRRLRVQARADGSLNEPVALADVLDDLATIGLEGASDLYLREIKIWQQETEIIRDINPATGDISQR